MDWFRPVLGSIALLALTLALFFATPLLAVLGAPFAAAGTAALYAFLLLRVALLLGGGFLLARVTGRGQAAWPVGILVAAPSILVGGLMGVFGALQPIHLVVVAALAVALLASCVLGARQGEAA